MAIHGATQQQRLKVVLKIDYDEAHAEQAQTDVRRMNQALSKSRDEMEQFSKNLKGIYASIRAIMWYRAARAIGSFLQTMNSYATRTIGQFQLLELSMHRLTNSAAEYQRMSDAIVRVGYESFGVRSMEKAFVQLRTTGIQPTERTLKSLVNYMMSTGHTSKRFFEETISKLVGLWQLGNIGMDDALKELSQQIPVVMTALKSATGMGELRLLDEFRKRRMVFSTVIQSLFHYLETNYSKLAVDTDKILLFALAKLHNIPEVMFREFAKSGAAEELSMMINRMLGTLNKGIYTGETTQVFNELGAAVGKLASQFGIQSLDILAFLRKINEWLNRISEDNFIQKISKAFDRVADGMGKIYTAAAKLSEFLLKMPDNLLKGAAVGWITSWFFGPEISIPLAVATAYLELLDKVNTNWSDFTNKRGISTITGKPVMSKEQQEIALMEALGLPMETPDEYRESLDKVRSMFNEVENFKKEIANSDISIQQLPSLPPEAAMSDTSRLDDQIDILVKYGKEIDKLRSKMSVELPPLRAPNPESMIRATDAIDTTKASLEELVDAIDKANSSMITTPIVNLYSVYQRLNTFIDKMKTSVEFDERKASMASLSGVDRQIAETEYSYNSFLEKVKPVLEQAKRELAQAYTEPLQDRDNLLVTQQRIKDLEILIKRKKAAKDAIIHGILTRQKEIESQKAASRATAEYNRKMREQDALRQQLEAQSKKTQGSMGQLTSTQQQLDRQLRDQSLTEFEQQLAHIDDQLEDRITSYNEQRDKIIDDINAQIEILQKLGDLSGIPALQAQIKSVQYAYDQLSKKAMVVASNQKKALIDPLLKLKTTIADSVGGWLSDFINGLQDGKLKFDEFAVSILKRLTEMLIQAYILDALVKGIGQIMGLGTSTATHTSPAPPPVSEPSYVNPSSATALTNTAATSTYSAQAAYSAPNVQINIENQTGSEVAASSGAMQFDGEKYVTSMVLRNVSRRGELYDLFKK